MTVTWMGSDEMDLDAELGKVDIHTLKNTCNEHGSANTIIIEVLLCMCKGMCGQAIVHVHDIVCTMIDVLYKETEWRIHLGSEVELGTPNELPEESDEEEEAMSTEEQVQEAVNHLSSARDIEMQLRPV